MPNTRRPQAQLRRRPTSVRPTGRVAVVAKPRGSSPAAEAKRLAGAAARAQAAVNEAGGGPPGTKPRKPLGAAFSIGPVKPVWQRAINAMVYGPYGHGKTTFAASALDVPEMLDVLFINADSGTMSLTSRRGLDTIDINKYDQLARIYEYLMLHCMWRDQGNVEKLLEAERELKSTVIDMADQTGTPEEGRTWFVEQRLRIGKPLDEPFLYRTVILDSLSELHKYLVYKFTGVDIGKTKLDEEIERMEEWQPAQELFRLLIRSFRDLPMNVIFVSAESLVEPDRKKGRLRTQMLPKLAGQMAGDVAGFIDIVGYLVREIEPGGDTHRYLYLGAGYEGWISKHRFENLPDLDFVEDPTLTSLIELSRKDAEHGASQARADAPRSTVPPSRNATGSATPQRRSGTAPSGTGSGSGRRGGRDNSVRRAGR